MEDVVGRYCSYWVEHPIHNVTSEYLVTCYRKIPGTLLLFSKYATRKGAFNCYYYNYFLLQFIFLYCNNFHVVQIENDSPIKLPSEEPTTTTELEIKPSKFLFTTRIPPLNGKYFWVLLYYHVKI